MNKKESKEVYLYDPRYNLKELITYEKLSELFGISVKRLAYIKFKKTRISKIWYILDTKASKTEFKELYLKEKFDTEVWKEVEGSDGVFLISNYGRFKRRFKSSPEGRFILPYFISRDNDKNRHKQFIKVKFMGVYREYNVARLVAYHYVDIYYEGRAVGSSGKAIKYKNKTYDELIVYHKNGLVHDNYHGNLEWLDREDLGKKVGNKNRNGRGIIAKDSNTEEVIGYFKSTRDVEKHLPVSKSAVSEGINGNRVVGGIYKFEYED